MAENAMEDCFYEGACFASQQAAEKAAVFQKLGALAWGHSVYDLLRVLAKRVNVPEDILNCGRGKRIVEFCESILAEKG